MNLKDKSQSFKKYYKHFTKISIAIDRNIEIYKITKIFDNNELPNKTLQYSEFDAKNYSKL